MPNSTSDMVCTTLLFYLGIDGHMCDTIYFSMNLWIDPVYFLLSFYFLVIFGTDLFLEPPIQTKPHLLFQMIHLMRKSHQYIMAYSKKISPLFQPPKRNTLKELVRRHCFHFLYLGIILVKNYSLLWKDCVSKITFPTTTFSL